MSIGIPSLPIGWGGSADLSAAIRTIFANGAKGGWYDPSDIATLFQDSAGTTPVTAVEQPVGRMLDKSGNLNHLLQATAAARPVYSARLNILLKSEQFDDAAWTKSTGGTGLMPVVTPNAAIAPDGALTADRAVFDKGVGATSTDQSALISTISATVTGQPSCGFIWIKSATANSYTMRLDFAAVASVGASYPSTITVTPTWQRFEVRIPSAIDAVRRITLRLRGTLGTSDYADVHVWGAQQENAVAASRYQWVNTATDYNAAGFPTYLKFDGVDDAQDVTFPLALGNSCTVARAVPDMGASILTAQTIGTTYSSTATHAGLIIIDRALTAPETATVTAYLNAKAGV